MYDVVAEYDVVLDVLLEVVFDVVREVDQDVVADPDVVQYEYQ